MTTTIDVQGRLAAMRQMTAPQLREKYLELFGEESRSGNRQWLYRRCAWRLQALAEGDLSERARRRAREIARDADIRVRAPRGMKMPPANQHAVTRAAPKRIRQNSDDRLPMPGTRLTRDYKGTTYEVEVLDGAFAFDGQVYRSLSAIAQAITGSHWNGYLFFGFNNPNKEQR
jgi:hypothetical protein